MNEQSPPSPESSSPDTSTTTPAGKPRSVATTTKSALPLLAAGLAGGVIAGLLLFLLWQHEYAGNASARTTTAANTPDNSRIQERLNVLENGLDDLLMRLAQHAPGNSNDDSRIDTLQQQVRQLQSRVNQQAQTSGSLLNQIGAMRSGGDATLWHMRSWLASKLALLPSQGLQQQDWATLATFAEKASLLLPPEHLSQLEALKDAPVPSWQALQIQYSTLARQQSAADTQPAATDTLPVDGAGALRNGIYRALSSLVVIEKMPETVTSTDIPDEPVPLWYALQSGDVTAVEHALASQTDNLTDSATWQQQLKRYSSAQSLLTNMLAYIDGQVLP